MSACELQQFAFVGTFGFFGRGLFSSFPLLQIHTTTDKFFLNTGVIADNADLLPKDQKHSHASATNLRKSAECNITARLWCFPSTIPSRMLANWWRCRENYSSGDACDALEWHLYLHFTNPSATVRSATSYFDGDCVVLALLLMCAILCAVMLLANQSKQKLNCALDSSVSSTSLCSTLYCGCLRRM